MDTRTDRLAIETFPAPGPDVVAGFECRPSHGHWIAAGDVSRGPHGLVVSRLELRPGSDPASGITGGLMRTVPVGEILNRVRADVSSAELPEAGQESSAQRRGGRAMLSDALLKEVALAYLRETAPGKPAGATRRMAEHFGRPEGTIRTWLSRAREDQWLGPSVKGRAGAEPGPRLHFRMSGDRPHHEQIEELGELVEAVGAGTVERDGDGIAQISIGPEPAPEEAEALRRMQERHRSQK